MKNYILMLGVAGVVLGSYAAYAGNSATMTVTATITHDVSLTKTGDLSLGTITINPAYNGPSTVWNYSDSGEVNYITQGAIVSASDATFGTFTANIPNPSACNGTSDTCGGLLLGFSDTFGSPGNSCGMNIKHISSNNFKILPDICFIDNASQITTGPHSETITIYYNPE
ncbi:MAG: hypothetical protein IJ689_07665 [Alphaproteobacteria bacterium]|nr:hypothetical protein [Alphaproteobacteria bacterium]MBR1649453.1 hypothetical protein [Alphaproteobacteria bacterium]